MKTLKDKEMFIEQGFGLTENGDNTGFGNLDVYLKEDVKEAVLEFIEWDLFAKEYPHKDNCMDCGSFVAIWYSKNDKTLCKDCLTVKIFGDFN